MRFAIAAVAIAVVLSIDKSLAASHADSYQFFGSFLSLFSSHLVLFIKLVHNVWVAYVCKSNAAIFPCVGRSVV